MFWGVLVRLRDLCGFGLILLYFGVLRFNWDLCCVVRGFRVILGFGWFCFVGYFIVGLGELGVLVLLGLRV